MKQIDFNKFLDGLTPEKRAALTTALYPLTCMLTTQSEQGMQANIAYGETADAICKVFAKAGSAGQVRGYCREHKIVRSTFYNNRRTYRWEVLVPDEFKAIAEKHGMSLDDAARNAIIRIALGAKHGTVTDADEALTELAEEPDNTGDPILAAVKRAAHVLVAACKGDLDKVADQCQYEDSLELAKDALQLTATNLMAASQLIAIAAFDEIKKLAETRTDLGKLKLPEAATITQEVRNRIKQLTGGNPPAQA